MDANKILSADLLDILFEDRNKDYGAYELRRSYNKRILMALIITASIALLALLGSVLMDQFASKKPKEDIKEVTIQDIKQQEEPPKELPPPPPPKPPEPPKIETKQFTPPKIVKDEEVQQPPPPQEDLSKAKISLENQAGTEDKGIVDAPPPDQGKQILEVKPPEDENKVFEKVGSEPTGRPFNSPIAVVDMQTHSGNPFVNAGAIATVSLISGNTADEKWNKILDFYSKVAGEKLTLIDEVYKSEAATNTGNKALSYLLAKYDRIYADPFESVDIYTKQCSVGVNASQLARMGATLANDGVNPATGERVIKSEDIPHILSTMMMAGLYDGSGGWAWSVGLPAKSGVGGGIVAIAPGKGAIAVFAPPLDEAGNSVKAQEVIRYVAERLNYNLFSPSSVGLK